MTTTSRLEGARGTKINGSDPPLTAVYTAYATPPFLLLASRVAPVYIGDGRRSLVIDSRRSGDRESQRRRVLRLLRAKAAHSSEELLKRLPTAECAWPLNGLSSEFPVHQYWNPDHRDR